MVFGAQHVDRAMNNRHIAVFEQIVALDSLTLSSPNVAPAEKNDRKEPDMMKILHTSDWHLGKMIYGRSLLQDQAHFLKEIFLPTVQKKSSPIV